MRYSNQMHITLNLTATNYGDVNKYNDMYLMVTPNGKLPSRNILPDLQCMGT